MKKRLFTKTVVSVALVAGMIFTVACAGAGSSDYSSSGANQLNTKNMPSVGDVVMKNGSTLSLDKIIAANKNDVVAIVYWVDESSRTYLGMGTEI